MNKYTILGSILACLLPCYVIFLSIFYDKLRTSLWAAISLCTGLTTTTYVVALFALYTPSFYPKWSVAIAIFFVGLFILVLFSVFKYSIPQQLFFLFLLRNYLDAIDLCLNSIQWICFGNLLTGDQYVYIMVMRYLLALLFTPFLWLFVKKLLRPILDRTEHMEFWKLIWLIPFFYFCIYQLSISITVTAPLSLFQRVLLPPLWTVCTFLSYYLILHMISETEYKNQIKEQLHTSEIRIISQEKQFISLKEKIDYTRRSQHDLRHFLLCIQKYVAERDVDALEKYLADSAHICPPPDSGFSFCSNTSLNAVIYHYMTLAKEAGIGFSAKASVPEVVIQSESDVCIIIGNLLENALEACLRTPHKDSYINLSMNYFTNNTLSIYVDNSYQSTVVQHGEIFSSSKRDGPGIGIDSIKNIAEKYCGLTKFKYDGHVFRSNILLSPIKKQ